MTTSPEGGARGAPQQVAGQAQVTAGRTGEGGSAGGDGSPVGGTVGQAGQSAMGGSNGPDFNFEEPPDQAITYMIDPGHSGAQLASSFEPPLQRLWTIPFGSAVSYPLIVGSRVFVTAWSAQNGTSETAPMVYALDADSGQTLWESRISYRFQPSTAHLAFDRGRVFATDKNGHAEAFESDSGKSAWTLDPADLYTGGTIPVAVGGALFVVGASRGSQNLFVADERDGSVAYSGNALGEGHPTFGNGLLFFSGACHETAALDARNGKEVWHYAENCFGGGGERTVLYRGIVFVADLPDSIVGLDAMTGKVRVKITEVDGQWPLAGFEDTVLLASDELRAYDISTGQRRWSVPLGNTAVLPVLVTRGVAWVLVGQTFQARSVLGIDLSTHQIVWKGPNVVIPADSDVQNGTGPFQAMAADSRLLVVAVDRTLTAFAPMTP